MAKFKQKYQANIPNCRVVFITLFILERVGETVAASRITNKFAHRIEPKANSQSISANLIKSDAALFLRFFLFCFVIHYSVLL